jgi:uncharacterized protein
VTLLAEMIATVQADAPVSRVCQGLFQTALTSRACGLAATLYDDTDFTGHQVRPPVTAAGTLTGRSALETARLALSESLPEASLGMAALNSLLEVDPARCAEVNARDELLRLGAGRRVAVVGHFPFVAQLRAGVRALDVLEQRPRPGDLDAAAAPEVIPRADVVAISGTACTNHTLEALLALCRADAYVVLLGGSVPLSPVLFDYGVDAVAGTLVTDADEVYRVISQGGTFRQIQGIRRVILRREAKRDR